MAKQRSHDWRTWCSFGQHEIENGKQHIYPIPKSEAFPEGGSNGEGATCCLACFPGVRQLQIDQGLYIPRSAVA